MARRPDHAARVITLHREEIIRRCREKVAARSVPPPTASEIEHGVPLFLDQLGDALRLGESGGTEISSTAVQHGHDLLRQGFTVSQVVHDYGDVCQAITELAVETDAPISADDFRVLNGCLDHAIAGAVTQFGRERNQSTIDSDTDRENVRPAGGGRRMRRSPRRRPERSLPPLRTARCEPDRIGARPRIQPMGCRGEPWPNLCAEPPWRGMRLHCRPAADPRSCHRGRLTLTD